MFLLFKICLDQDEVDQHHDHDFLETLFFFFNLLLILNWREEQMSGLSPSKFMRLNSRFDHGMTLLYIVV